MILCIIELVFEDVYYKFILILDCFLYEFGSIAEYKLFHVNNILAELIKSVCDRLNWSSDLLVNSTTC